MRSFVAMSQEKSFVRAAIASLFLVCSNGSAMTSRAHPVPKTQNGSSQMRGIPSVDELLGRPRLLALAEKAGRALVTQSARTVLANLRAQMKDETAGAGQSIDREHIEALIVANVEALLAPSLRRVINASGVILHTNLGRAPLSATAREAVTRAAEGYSNLELDLASGD